MEKRSPQYKLSIVKALIDAGQVQTTKVAREGATALGIDFDNMMAVVMALTPSDFARAWARILTTVFGKMSTGPILLLVIFI